MTTVRPKSTPAAGTGADEAAAFLRRLARADEAVLMLDYDGTLAPFRIERDQAAPYEGVRERVRRLFDETDTRLVIISGRSVDAVSRLLGVDVPVEIWGSHGLERRRPDGEIELLELPDAHREGLQRGVEALEELSDDPDVEHKPAGVAVHVRGLDDDAARRMLDAVEAAWANIEHQTPLEIHHFDGGLELRSEFVDKGHAVETILGDVGADAAVAYLGDDRTDEDAFRELGDDGLTVLVRDEIRVSRADVWVEPPSELLVFLDRWIATRQTTSTDRR